MNWIDIKMRWPYYLLVLLCSIFVGINTNFINSNLTLITLIFLLFRICSKYYMAIEKPWKMYLILALIFGFYLRLNANSFNEMTEDYMLNILSFHCLTCIFVLFMRNPKIYDSSYVFVFNFLMLVGGSISSSKTALVYAVEVYIIASITVFTAIRYAHVPKKKYLIQRSLWFFFTLILIFIISNVFELNNARIENYFSRFTNFNSVSNKDSMALNSMEKTWGDEDELNKIILRAYSEDAPKHLRSSTFDTFRNNNWVNTIKEHDTKLDSVKIDDDYITRLYNSPKPNIENPDCTVYLTMMTSGQLLITDKTTWLKTNMPIKRIDGNGYIYSYAGRSGYSLYYPERRSVEVSNTLDYYQTTQLNLLPKDENYIKELSDSITSSDDSILVKVTKIHQYLKANHQYEISPKIPETENPIVYFLQNKTNAHCQYFSSAAVFLLRAQNVPCRIASGYLCVRYNSFGKYWVSKGIDCHAWVEYYDNGWKTFDPTEGARITEDTKLFLLGYEGTYDYLDFKLTHFAWQIMSGEFKEYLGKLWEKLVDILVDNVNLVYSLAILTFLYILYVKVFRRKRNANEILLIYTPPHANKKQIVDAYLKVIRLLENNNITLETKDTIDSLIKKINDSSLSNETKTNFVEIIMTYQANRFKSEING